MLDYSRSREQLDELRAAHRRTRDKREADRIKAVVALATGWTAEEVAELLQIDPNTARNHFKRYRTEGLAGLNRVGEGVGGSPSLLTEEQLIRLVPVDNSLIFINFMNRLRAKRTDSLTNRFFLLSRCPPGKREARGG